MFVNFRFLQKYSDLNLKMVLLIYWRENWREIIRIILLYFS
jgi:hypothetical protein